MSQIKYNNKTIKKLEHNASEVNKMYYDDNVAYGVDGGSPEPPTPPSFDGKWLATYTGGTTSSAQCDTSSAITSGEISKTDLQSVEIGDCVTRIGNSAFEYCYSLTSATIGNGVTSIGRYAFLHCSSLTSVTILDSVVTIGSSAFGQCSSLTGVTIPDSVTTIGENAFGNCTNLISVTIGSGVNFIYGYAFASCSGLTSVTINATTPPTLIYADAFEGTNNCPIYVPAASVNAYKTATYWSTYASRIQAIPQ